MRRLQHAVLVFLLLSVSPLLADDGSPFDGLSSQTKPWDGRLRSSLVEMEHPSSAEETTNLTTPADAKVAAVAPVAPEYEPASWQQDLPPETPFFTLSELQGEMENLVWMKNDVKIIPYGSLWGSVAYDTERTTPRRFTLWVNSRMDEGESAFVIDTRRTRLGINVDGSAIPLFGSGRFRGKVETDFYGLFLTENQPAIRLRHAYGEIKTDNYSLLAGQTWDLISPLFPETINFPVGWAAGNIGFRRMQIRLTNYYYPSSRVILEVAGAIADSVINELSSVPGIERETSNWPLLEGRVGVRLAGLTNASSPATFGISAHIGEEGFDFTAVAPPPADDVRVQTWSFNVDVRIPVTDKWGIQGEFFTGQNLATFLGGIVQGVDSTTREGIHSTGGWAEVWYDWNSKWHSRSGYSVDDPRNEDMTSASARTFNQFFFVNTTYDVTKNMNFGVEISHWTTEFLGKPPGETVRFECAGMYKF